MAGACPSIIFAHASGQYGHEGASADTGQLNQLRFLSAAASDFAAILRAALPIFRLAWQKLLVEPLRIVRLRFLEPGPFLKPTAGDSLKLGVSQRARMGLR